MTVKIVFVMFLGLAAGFAVGSGFVAFLAVLGIIPRLMQLSKTMKMVIAYEWAVILGTIAGGMGGIWNPSLMLPPWIMIPIGAACGIFVGMMAAALTEVLNVFPILTKKIGITREDCHFNDGICSRENSRLIISMAVFRQRITDNPVKSPGKEQRLWLIEHQEENQSQFRLHLLKLRHI